VIGHGASFARTVPVELFYAKSKESQVSKSASQAKMNALHVLSKEQSESLLT
jgi:hypothetical protein